MSSNPVNGPVVGLDIGTSRIVAAKCDVVKCDNQRPDREFRYDSQLNAFVTIPFSKLTEAVLERERIPHTSLAGDLVIHGNESEKFAGLLNAEIRRPMANGVLDAKEPESLRIMREIIALLLGGGKQERQKLCFTVPAAPLGGEDGLTYHEATIRQILTELGYDPVVLNEGLAVIYSELESSNYTGIGISLGGGLCNVCLAYLSVPVLSFSIPKAGDFIDASAAAVTGERANRIRLTKEDSFHFNGFFADKVHQVLGVYYDDMILSLVTGLKEAFTRTRDLPTFNRPVPMVLSGGTTMPPGFRDRFEKLLWEHDFPIKISDIRLAQNPLHATAKGALMYALSDL